MQNGRLALGAFGPTFWISARPGLNWLARGGLPEPTSLSSEVGRARFLVGCLSFLIWSLRPPTFRRGAGGGHFIKRLARRL